MMKIVGMCRCEENVCSAEANIRSFLVSDPRIKECPVGTMELQ